MSCFFEMNSDFCRLASAFEYFESNNNSVIYVLKIE